MKNLKTQLTKLSKSSKNNLEKYVISYILSDYKTNDEIKNFFSDLLQNGCQSGMIGTLIYYADTAAFYDKFYAEIEELRCDLEDSMGEPVKINGDLKNFFAWLGFEETARNIANQIGLEY